MKKIKGGVNLYQNKEPAFTREQRRFLNPQILYIPMSQDVDYKISTAFLGEVIFLGEFNFKYPGVENSKFGRIKLKLTEEELAKINETSDYNDDKPIVIKSVHIDKLIDVAKKAFIIDETDGQPLFRKLLDFKKNPRGGLIVNAVDDEPFVSSNINTLIKKEKKIEEIFSLLCKSLEIENKYILTYADLDDAKSSIPKKIGEIEVKRIRERYPIEKRKDLIMKKNGVKNPGYIGVQALLHLYRAVYFNKNQTTTIVTVAGDCVGYPCNVEVVIGTTLQEVLEYSGLIKDPKRVIIGGSMRGIAVDHLDLPVLHTTRSILAFEGNLAERKLPCVNCGRCADVCPSGLFPEHIYKYNRVGDSESILKLEPKKCIKCGLCSYICPSGLELSQTISQIADQIEDEKPTYSIDTKENLISKKIKPKSKEKNKGKEEGRGE